MFIIQLIYLNISDQLVLVFIPMNNDIYMKYKLSSFIHLHVIADVYDFFSSVKYKIRYLDNRVVTVRNFSHRLIDV